MAPIHDSSYRPPARRPLVALVATALALSAAPYAAPVAQAGTLRLAGVLQTTEAVIASAQIADEWRFPVGGPHPFPEADSGAAAEPAYRVLRTVSRNSRGRLLHQGVDLGNQRSGGIVQAAAAGIVVRAARDRSGYGEHVVVAHRLAGGSLLYTVYAHLGAGTTLVSQGDGVRAGTPIGEVGRTGRATTPHLHFEIRQPSDPGDRWELAPVLEPLAFFEERAVATAAVTSPSDSLDSQ